MDLKYMADDEYIANLTFLAGVTRLLERFSTEFQVPSTCCETSLEANEFIQISISDYEKT